MLLEKIDELLKEVSTLTAQNAEEVEQLRIKYLSKKGEINALMADFRTVPADQKKEVGVKINELKNAALEKINGLKEQMEEAEASLVALFIRAERVSSSPRNSCKVSWLYCSTLEGSIWPTMPPPSLRALTVP